MGLFRRAKPMDPAEIERMKAEMASLREALERHGSSATALESRVGELDARAIPPDPSAGSTSWRPRWPSSTPG